MSFREIVVIIGILVVVVIIWDATRQMRRRKIDKQPVNAPPVPGIEASGPSELKTDQASALVKMPSDEFDESKIQKQETKTQSETLSTDIPALTSDTEAESVLKNDIMTATIGKNTFIDGDIRGCEDLIIEGVVKGNVIFKNSNITIGIHGQVIGNVYANSVHIEGVVEGSVFSAYSAALCKSAQIRGSINSPALSIESGANLQGSCIMEPESKL